MKTASVQPINLRDSHTGHVIPKEDRTFTGARGAGPFSQPVSYFNHSEPMITRFHKQTRLLRLVCLVAASAVMTGQQLPAALADPLPVRGLQEVPSRQVKLSGGFWGPRLKLHNDVTIPHALDERRTRHSAGVVRLVEFGHSRACIDVTYELDDFGRNVERGIALDPLLDFARGAGLLE